jgi:hypothetical protein
MTATADVTRVEQPANAARGRPGFASGPVIGIAIAFVAVELAVAARYGIHRDELYFIACARHLAWGYVDQPPLVPFVARIAITVGGPHAFALRVAPALAGGGAVMIGALMARELGGERIAQTFAALAGATSAAVLATTHLLSTATFDLFFWALLCLLVLRLIRFGDPRWWIAIGATAGVALLNKYNIAFLLVGVGVGLAATPSTRALLRTRWLLAGGAIALLLVAPNIAWNAHHHWAAIAMLRSLHRENGSVGASLGFVPSQLFIVGPALIVLWVAGLRRLFDDTIGRVFAIAYVVLLALDTLGGAKPYYLTGIYFVLFAAGGVWYERRLARRPGHPLRTAVIFVVVAAASLPLTLPVLPAGAQPTSGWLGGINKDLSATIGWKGMARQVASVANSLPASERSRLVVFTGDYGAAGAVDLYGSVYGLPHAISGHNSYWWWGPGRAPDDSTTITVDVDRGYLETLFADVRLVGVVRTPGNVWTEERGDPIYLCRGQRRAWRVIWPSARHYG